MKDLRDGITSVLGGIDSGRLPNLINQDQLAYAINCTMRGGHSSQRQAFDEQAITFTDDEQETWITTHKLQGAYTYKSRGSNTRQLVATYGGRSFLIDPFQDFVVREITPRAGTTLAAQFAVPAIGATVNVTVLSSIKAYVGYPMYIGDYVYRITAVSATGDILTVQNINDTSAGPWGADPSNFETVYFLDASSKASDRVWFLQAEEWLVIQDGREEPLVYNGNCRRASYADEEKPEIPTGTCMAYVNGRIWVAVNGNEIAAGDISGGPTSVITFSEEVATSIGPSNRFRVSEEITALTSCTNIDTSMGQGPLLIFTRSNVSSLNVPVVRSLWGTTSYPLQTVSLAAGGATSHASVVNVNSDLFYRAPDGYRSLILARREASTWGNTPVSTEMDRAIRNDSPELLHKASAIVFDNRLLATVAPSNNDNGVYHRGLAVLDFSVISRMGQKSPPAWEGVWNGVRFTYLVAGDFYNEERAFAFALSSTSANVLYEIRKDLFFDNGTTRIQTTIESRSFDWKAPVDLKRLASCEIWVDDIQGVVDFDLKWRPDQAPCWYDWGTKQICVTYTDCDQNSASCKDLDAFKPGYRTRIGFGAPPSDCEAMDNKRAELGYEHQIKLSWVGKCRIRKILIRTQATGEMEYPICNDDQIVADMNWDINNGQWQIQNRTTGAYHAPILDDVGGLHELYGVDTTTLNWRIKPDGTWQIKNRTTGKYHTPWLDDTGGTHIIYDLGEA